MLQILDTGIAQAEENMQKDQALLSELDPQGEPILHLYDWEKPSLTFGFFVDPEKHIHLDQAKKYGLALAKRPTGGGIVFHISDFAFSFLMPSQHPAFFSSTLENYRFVNAIVLDAVSSFFQLEQSLVLTPSHFPIQEEGCQNFCMARPTQYDVVYGNKKIAGAAQRRKKNGYLHQGTISLALPNQQLLTDVLSVKKEVIEAMASHTFAPLGNSCSFSDLQALKRLIQQELIRKLMEKLSTQQ